MAHALVPCSSLNHFGHEHELKGELDGTWAVRHWSSCTKPVELPTSIVRAARPLEVLLGLLAAMGGSCASAALGGLGSASL